MGGWVGEWVVVVVALVVVILTHLLAGGDDRLLGWSLARYAAVVRLKESRHRLLEQREHLL